MNLAPALVLDAGCPVGKAVAAARLLTESAFVVVVDRAGLPVRYLTWGPGAGPIRAASPCAPVLSSA